MIFLYYFFSTGWSSSNSEKVTILKDNSLPF